MRHLLPIFDCFLSYIYLLCEYFLLTQNLAEVLYAKLHCVSIFVCVLFEHDECLSVDCAPIIRSVVCTTALEVLQACQSTYTFHTARQTHFLID
jgi:hypothetical protein